MGISNPHALGRNQKFFAKIESAAGTFDKPAGSDAIKVRSSTFDWQVARDSRIDARQTRSLLERITNKQSVSWSLSKYIIPNGSAGTAPDDADLWEAALGSEAVTGGTRVTYSLSASQTIKTLSMVRDFNEVFQEALRGAVVNQVTLSGSGGDAPTVTFEGFAYDYGFASRAVVDGNHGAGTTFDTTAATTAALRAPCIIKIGTDDNSGAGYEVSSVDDGTEQITLSASHGGVSNADVVLPIMPTETTAGSPIAGISGSLQLDSTTVPITAFELTLNNNHIEVSDQAFEAGTTDAVPGFREVTGSFTFRARQDLMIWLAERRSYITSDVDLTLGSVAGSKVLIEMPKIELNFQAIDVPEADGATITVPFVALGTSGEDELTIKFE